MNRIILCLLLFALMSVFVLSVSSSAYAYHPLAGVEDPIPWPPPDSTPPDPLPD